MKAHNAIITVYAKHWSQMVYPHNCVRHVLAQQMKCIWGLNQSALTSQEILPLSHLIWWSLNADKSTVSSHTPTLSQHLLCCSPTSLESFYWRYNPLLRDILTVISLDISLFVFWSHMKIWSNKNHNRAFVSHAQVKPFEVCAHVTQLTHESSACVSNYCFNHDVWVTCMSSRFKGHWSQLHVAVERTFSAAGKHLLQCLISLIGQLKS